MSVVLWNLIKKDPVTCKNVMPLFLFEKICFGQGFVWYEISAFIEFMGIRDIANGRAGSAPPFSFNRYSGLVYSAHGRMQETGPFAHRQGFLSGFVRFTRLQEGVCVYRFSL